MKDFDILFRAKFFKYLIIRQKINPSQSYENSIQQFSSYLALHPQNLYKQTKNANPFF